MDGKSIWLDRARQFGEENRHEEARALFEKIVTENSEDSVDAAYSLGIYYHLNKGMDGPIGLDERLHIAEKYYKLAAAKGHSMALYRLAFLAEQRGEIIQAYEQMKLISSVNPSAAYWLYIWIKKYPNLSAKAGEAEFYLEQSIEQGHYLAERANAKNYLAGKHGLKGIGRGLMLYVRFIVRLTKFTGDSDDIRLR